MLKARPLLLFFQAKDGIRDYWRDWSSDVCSSDLLAAVLIVLLFGLLVYRWMWGRFGYRVAKRTRTFEYASGDVFSAEEPVKRLETEELERPKTVVTSDRKSVV